MFEEQAGAATAVTEGATACEAQVAAPVGVVAMRIAEAADTDGVFYIAADEQRAEAVAAALRIAVPDAQIIHCPSSDALPGDSAPASPANVGRRVAALRCARLAEREPKRATIFVTTAEAAARGYAPAAAFDDAPPMIAVGDTLDIDALSATLVEIGYIADDRVDEPGEVAVRGSVIDLFPADAPAPARIEIVDGRVTAIRAYDAITQLGDAPLERIEIGRITEPAPGDAWTSLFDHMPGAKIAIDPEAAARRDRYIALWQDAARARSAAAEPVVDEKRWAKALRGRDVIDVTAEANGEVPRFVESKQPMRAFARFAKAAEADGLRLLVLGAVRDLRFLAPRLARATGREAMNAASWREACAVPRGQIALLAMPVERGWTMPGRAVVAASDLLGSRALADEAGGGVVDPLHGDAGEIRTGDVVVHESFGIGIVAGLDAMAGDGDAAGDAIVLEYAGGARRLVPVEDAALIWRYGADADAVTLDKLDGSSWEKRRADIDRTIAESARGLTALAAEREQRTAPVFDPDTAAYERFASGFPFTETADQARAIAAVRTDLVAAKPMDRLVVGDVGYGKTEVALRAAALVALAGGQAVIAAPTTVLVRQHIESFQRRFQGAGIVVAGLSRLSTAAEKKVVKAGLADGSIGIVVGTAAVAGKGIAYNNLGLVVIDEEQRFGAADKAKLRALQPDAHVLTLTATPIPRTLQMALIGLQQVSVIATPPARRQPIRTSIAAFDPVTVRTALMREKGRGGQSFVVVPRIDDMAVIADKLATLVPDLIVRQAHGKLPAAEIDEAMVRFAGGDGDVLLATNIIEAGLDVPRANTMIVWRADRFGLSQLHQLRGRVGRGSRRGQILLLTEADATIAESTVKRLRTLEAFDRLGAGFAISARDLDMRGAGDLLGDAQAGHMKLIGVDLYQHLLEGALRTARGETVERWNPVLHLGIAGRLPTGWIPEEDVRIALYGRLARIVTPAALDALESELEDRFGALPPDSSRLIGIARLRLAACAARIARIDAGPSAIALTPRADFDGDASGLTAKDGRLLCVEKIDDPDRRLDRIQILLDDLNGGHD